MTSKARKIILGDQSYFHLMWQCHNKDFLLESDWAKDKYYSTLLKYKNDYQLKFYSYCLMSNHIHLAGYCESRDLFSNYFRLVNSVFARSYNKKFDRRGQVILDRFQSPQIKSNNDLFRVMAYIDLNPVLAGMVDHPKEYPYSSYHYYAFGQTDLLIDDNPTFQILGNTDSSRREKYRRLVDGAMDYKLSLLGKASKVS